MSVRVFSVRPQPHAKGLAPDAAPILSFVLLAVNTLAFLHAVASAARVLGRVLRH